MKSAKSKVFDKPKSPEPLVFEKLPCKECGGEKHERPSGFLRKMRQATLGDVVCGYCDEGTVLHVYDKIGTKKEPVELRVWLSFETGMIAAKFRKANKRWPTWNEIEAIVHAEEDRFNRRFPNNHRGEPYHHHHKQPTQVASQ